MARYRLARLESLFKKELSDIIRHEIKDVDFGLTSITKVILSGDLQHAKVYVSIYAGESRQAELMRQLKKSSGFVRGVIGRRIRMRYTPEIDFIHDKSMEEADRIFKLMQDIKEQRTKPSR